MMISNDELERIWKESVAPCFKLPSHHLSEGAEENHKKK